MKTATADKLLLQPTVHAQWLEQKGAVLWALPTELVQDYFILYRQWQNSGLAWQLFINKPEAEQWCLHEDDTLFSLLTSTAFLLARWPDLLIAEVDAGLHWALTTPKADR